jgi:hypothetical protein
MLIRDKIWIVMHPRKSHLHLKIWKSLLFEILSWFIGSERAWVLSLGSILQQDRSATFFKDLWNKEPFPHRGCWENYMGVTEAVAGARKGVGLGTGADVGGEFCVDGKSK